jgi:hypothetical protein
MSCIVAIPGPIKMDVTLLSGLTSEFGWKLRIVDRIADVRASGPDRAAAILFHNEALKCPWLEAVGRLRRAAPLARLVACHGFADGVEWAELRNAGVFHTLWLPFTESELRQSLGFIWQAEQRAAVWLGA